MVYTTVIMTQTLNVKPFSQSVDMTDSIKAVVYGPKFPSTSIVVNQKDFTKMYKLAGESTVVTLTGLDVDMDTLIHDIQKNVINGSIIHADFYALEKGKKITVHVPLLFVGTADAIKTHGADIIKNIFEVEVEAEAKDLPHEIEIDLSVLKEVDDHITIADIKAPKGVEILNHATDVIVTASKHEEEKEEDDVLDMSAIKVSDQKGKKDDEEVAE